MDKSHADILLSEDDAGMHAGDVIDLSEDAGVSSSYGVDLCEDADSEGSDGALDGSDAAEGRADGLEALLRRAGAVMEVLTAACRDRLRGHLRQIDEIVKSLFGHLKASQGNSASQELGEVHDSQRSGDVHRIELKSVEWGREDRAAMLRFCDQYYLPMLPLASDVERVEMVRQMVEYSLRSRFNEAQVMVFESSAGQLATPGSDIDLTLCLPTRARLIQELKIEYLRAVDCSGAEDRI